MTRCPSCHGPCIEMVTSVWEPGRPSAGHVKWEDVEPSCFWGQPICDELREQQQTKRRRRVG